jgi:hypothetical protein
MRKESPALRKPCYHSGHDVNPLAHSHDEALDFHRLQPIKSLASRTAITVAVDCFVSNEGLMGNLHWRRVASGIALIIATLALVLLHKLNYSREHQFFGIALVGVFGFLFLSSSEPAQDEPWW